jgi:spermidine synthase
MLSAFLLGLGLGSEVGRRWLRRSNPVLIIALAEFALSASIALTAHGWESIPRYFSSFGLAAISLPFSGREAIRALVCLLVMLPPALCIGIVYPAAMSISAPALGRSRESRGVGAASALNTAGNIAGVLVTGFLLLPQFGSLQVLKAFALAAFALAFAAAALTAQRHAFFGVRRRAAVTATAALGSAWALYAYPGGWNYQDLTMGANLYFQDQGWGRHVEHAESVSGGLTSVAISEDGVHTLLTNGKLQGDDAQGRDRVAQVAIAMPSLLHTAERGSALVIGYGTGMATNVMHAAGFRRIEVVELARDIVSLADKYFESTNGGVLRQPGVALHITDGRNFLLTQNRRFDVVSIQLSGVWFAGAANLYSKEFYDLVQRRLNPDGVLQQWIQLHHIYPIDLVYVIGSVRAKFRYVWLYVVGAQGIIVASNSDRALDPGPALTRILETATMEQYIAMFAGRPEQLARLVQLTPAEVDRIVTRVDPEFKVFASTDTNLFLEYSTPKGNARTEPDVVRTNLRALHQMARGP